MAAAQQSVPQELLFAARQFASYYGSHPVAEVPGFSSREFGFMFFDRGYVHRHVGFNDRADLQKYLAGKAPSHAYYSTAYYEMPAAHTMAEKGWLGADLIFDLDADHVKGSEGLPYEKMLARVKEEMIRLYDDFVCSDLGFSEKETEIVFSGGRGYHIHVYADSVRKLGSHERREIVDYITATELDLGILFSSTVVDEARSGRPLKMTKLPEISEGGWYGRARRAMDSLLLELQSVPKEEALAMLVSSGVKKQQAARLYSALFEEGRKDRIQTESVLEVLTDREEDIRAFTALVQKRTVLTMAGQTDEPVTSDTHRLIRLPGSLHGKSSLKVVTLKRDELTDFEPLRDAVADFPDHPVTVYSEKAFLSEPVGGESVPVKEGANEIPLRTAIFLILRRKVRLQPPGGTG